MYIILPQQFELILSLQVGIYEVVLGGCILLDVLGAYAEVLRFVRNYRNENSSDRSKGGIAIIFILK